MKNFEQLHENILLNNKVVFTLAQLEKYVEDKELNYLSSPLSVENIHGKIDVYSNDIYMDVELYLDNEANFQNACTDFYNSMQPKDYPFGKSGIYNVTKAK